MVSSELETQMSPAVLISVMQSLWEPRTSMHGNSLSGRKMSPKRIVEVTMFDTVLLVPLLLGLISFIGAH